jgi:predicted phage tail protein
MSWFDGDLVLELLTDTLKSGELRSRAYANITDLVSEGEIEGLVDGARSIYLNGTPLQNPDGSYNFTGLSVQARPGTNEQTYIAGTPGVESENSVNTEFTNATSVTRTISNQDVDAVRLTLSVQALFKQKDNGDVVGESVNFAVDLQSNGGGYNEVLNAYFTGKATSKYQRSYRIELTGDGPWDIRVRRITADNTDLKIQNKTFWDSYTEIIDTKLRYPKSAIAHIKFNAESFDGIPTRGYDMKLLKVKVPSNYNPETRAYTGSWDGTFTTAWTDNPAWCFYDLVTSARYGIGGYIDATQVDKWALYSISQYCDELVPDGFGGTEPRFTCNMYLQSRTEAYKVIQDLASCFRSMVYWASGSLTLAQDAPSDPVALYTQANVLEGKFSYTGSSAKSRHTVALVTWNDPADMYAQKIEYVEDQEAIARFGVIPTEVVAVGCTSRGQANRVGRWLLFSERHQSEVVSFATGIEGAVARPGQVIKVADASRAGARHGGRVHSATTTAVTLDASVSLGASSWTMYVMLPDGTVETRAVSSATGAVVTLATALSAAPQPGAQWIMSTSTAEAQTFRVLSVSEQDNGVIEISALKHDPDKYDAVENGLVLQPRDITTLNDPPDTPTNGSVSEYLYATLTDVRVGATITWSQANLAATYLVSYRINNDNPVEVTTQSNALELINTATGDYEITVRAVSARGVKSQPYTFVASVLGKTARPADIAGLQMTVQADTGILQWESHADLDVRIGGQISVRYSEELDGAQWNTSLPIGDFPGSATSASVPLRAGTYLAKAKDSTGQMSQNAALIVTDAPNILQFNAVASSTQDPTFAGAKTDLVLLNDRLVLDQAEYMDDIEDWDEYNNLEGGLVTSGEYEFDTYVDTGAVYTSRVSATFSVLSYNIANMVDEWGLIDSLGLVDDGAMATDYVDTWTDWDAIVNFDLPNTTDDSSLQVFISTTNDNPADTPTWSAWRVFYVGDYTARAFKFKVKLIRGEDDNNQVALATLGVTVDVPDRVESANNVSVPSGGITVTFANAFFDVPATAITAENMATGDFAQITAKTSAGFTIQFKNSAGTGVARTMDWIAKGYGYRN